MYKTVVGVDGMMCSMCEAHVSEAIKKAFPEARSVKSNRRTKQAVILSDSPLEEGPVRRAIDATGYETLTFCCVPYEKKGGFLSRLFGGCCA